MCEPAHCVYPGLENEKGSKIQCPVRTTACSSPERARRKVASLFWAPTTCRVTGFFSFHLPQGNRPESCSPQLVTGHLIHNRPDPPVYYPVVRGLTGAGLGPWVRQQGTEKPPLLLPLLPAEAREQLCLPCPAAFPTPLLSDLIRDSAGATS
jgi:hypothetical protein